MTYRSQSHQLIRETFLVFALFLGIYFVTSAGHIDTVDAEASIETAQALLARGTLAVTPARPDPMLYRNAEDDRLYSKLGLLTPITYLLPVFVGEKFAKKTGLSAKLCRDFFVSLVNSLLSALLITGLFLFLRLRKHTQHTALILCAALGFGTLIFPYAKGAHREPLQALLLFTCFATVFLGAEKKTRFQHWLTASLCASLLLFTKAPSVLPALFAIGYAFVLSIRIQNRRELLAIGAPLSLSAILYTVHNISLFQAASAYSAEMMAFQGDVWSTPFLRGLFEQLISLESGLFITSPLLFCVFALIFGLKRDDWHRNERLLVLSAVALVCLFYARYWTPIGGNSLGPRYLVPIIPLLFLLIPQKPFHKLLQRHPQWVLTWLIVGITWQIPYVAVKPQQYWTLKEQLPQQTKINPTLTHWKLLSHKLQGQPEQYPVSTFIPNQSGEINLAGFETLQGLNFWWAHASRYLSQQSQTSFSRRNQESTSHTNPIAQMN